MFVISLSFLTLVTCQSNLSETESAFVTPSATTFTPTLTRIVVSATVTSTPILPTISATDTTVPTQTPLPTATQPQIPTVTPAPTLPTSLRSIELELIAHTGGEARALELRDDRLVYMVVGPRLQLFDATNRQNPGLLWQSEPFPEIFIDLRMVDDFAFGRLPDRWVVWQLLSNGIPALVWESEPELTAVTGNIFHLLLADKLYLRTDGDNWLVFDRQQPSFPLESITQDGYIHVVDGGLIIEQRTAERYTLLFAEGDALPAEIVGRLSLAESRSILAIHESYLYLSATSRDANDGLVISFADFTQPEIVSDQLPIYFPAIIQDNLLITIYGDRAVYDIATDPVNPSYLALIDRDPMIRYRPLYWQNPHLLMVAGASDAGYVWVSLVQLDLTDLSAPVETIIHRLPALNVTDIEIHGDLLFMLQSAQLTILDIADLAQIQEIGQIKMTGQGRYSLLATDVIFINANNYDDFARLIPAQFSHWPAGVIQLPVNAGHSSYIFHDTVFVVGDAGVSVYNLQTNKANFLQYNQIFLGGGWFNRGIAFNNDHAYFLGDKTLAVLDMTDPVNPVTLNNYVKQSPDGWWDSLVVAGPIAFVGGTHGVTSFDLSDPANPHELGFVAAEGYVNNLHLVGDALYGGQRNSYIFDVSDPEQPQVVGVFSGVINGFPYADFLIGSNNGDIIVFDVADPFNPMFVKEISVAGNGRVIGIRDNHLYVGSDVGLFVFAIEHNP